jgi:ADP-ribose pyrophosphatase YjhB (NUDIX family)
MLDYIHTLRSMIGNTRIIVPGVRALLFNEAGEILLEQQRLFDSWALPHGCVDVGESALGALKREVKEETGLDVIHAEAFGMYTDPKYSVIYPNGDEVQTFTIAFLVTEWTGELIAEAEEVIALRFFPLDRLPASLYPIHIDTIEDFRRHEHGFITK